MRRDEIETHVIARAKRNNGVSRTRSASAVRVSR
jgi:hypothetical protein